MATPKKPTISAELLEALHYSSPEEAALDMLLLSARSRYAECMQEVKQVEAKYQMDFASFQHMVETRLNAEDFEATCSEAAGSVSGEALGENHSLLKDLTFAL